MKIFESIWARYPSKDGKKRAQACFKATVKTAEDWDKINLALDKYLSSKRVKAGFIKNGSTWFCNWEDWIDWKEPSDTDTPAIFRKEEQSV